MLHLINVRPCDLAWLVEGDTFDNAIVFPSGALAERAARGLAEHYALAGEASEVWVFLRDGSLAGRVRFTVSGFPLAG